jgi:NADPH:quinone reductase-like Zn-dependent oxidoreductase
MAESELQVPKTMKAWTITRVGKPKDVLKLKINCPTPPPPKAGEVMIRVSHVSINPSDFKLMETWIPFRCNNNAIPGIDFVGEIVQIGHPTGTSNSSTNVRVGMTVAGSVPTMLILHGVGVLAEYVVLPAHTVVEKPQGLEEAVAAGLFGVAGQTSAMVLRDAGLHEGDRVLLNGASGGVGSVLIQVLCGMGVRVTGICSARNEALVRRLGAEEVRHCMISGRY